MAAKLFLDSKSHDGSESEESKSARSEAILALACVERASHAQVLSSLLTRVTLFGNDQLLSFKRLLSGHHGSPIVQATARQLAQAHVKHFCLLQDSTAISAAARDRARSSSLYDSVANTKAFERFVDAIDLSLLENLETLHIQGPPRVLETRRDAQHPKRELGLQRIRSKLKDLVCMLSLWGNGDAFEGLWEMGRHEANDIRPTGLRVSAWSSLSHLQLHGPRMRFSASTALALSRLPALSHLAIVLPRFVPQDADAAVYLDGKPVNAFDAAGRYSVLQVLVNVLLSLHELQLIGHEEEGYAGNVSAMPSMAAALMRKPFNKAHQPRWALRQVDPVLPDVTVHVVTLRRNTVDQRALAKERTHPTWFSRYMFARASRGRHWSLASAPEAANRQLDIDWGIAYSVDTFIVPEVSTSEEFQPHFQAIDQPIAHDFGDDLSGSDTGSSVPEEDSMDID